MEGVGSRERERKGSSNRVPLISPEGRISENNNIVFDFQLSKSRVSGSRIIASVSNFPPQVSWEQKSPNVFFLSAINPSFPPLPTKKKCRWRDDVVLGYVPADFLKFSKKKNSGPSWPGS